MRTTRPALPLLLTVLAVLALGLAWAPAVYADGSSDVAAASAAFSRAQEAELREDWANAASLYAMADGLIPSAAALRGTARCSLKAGRTASATTAAASLLERYSGDAASRSLAESILRQHAASLSRVRARCSVPCRLLVEGRLATTREAQEHVIFLRPGDRSLSASFENYEDAPAQTLALKADQRVSASFEPAPVATLADTRSSSEVGTAAESSGISAWYLASAAALTVGLGAASVWSGLEVSAAHDDYDPAAPDSFEKYDEGSRLERRTNVLLGATAGFAVTAAVLAFFTDFGGDNDKRPTSRARLMPTFSGSSRGAMVGVRGAFTHIGE